VILKIIIKFVFKQKNELSSAKKKQLKFVKKKTKITKTLYQPVRKIFHIVFPSPTLKAVLISFIHSIFLLFISLIWLTSVNIRDGFDFMDGVYDVKDFFRIYVFDAKPKKNINDRYLLINTSYSNQLISDNSERWNDVIVVSTRATTPRKIS